MYFVFVLGKKNCTFCYAISTPMNTIVDQMLFCTNLWENVLKAVCRIQPYQL